MDTKAFREGFRDGIPIGLGYLAVSFSLGISAKQAGLTPLQGFVTSFLKNASAGEYIAFTLIGAGATYIELCLMTIIANARYLPDELCHEPAVFTGYPYDPSVSCRI